MRSILFRADADIKSGTGDLLSMIYLAGYFKRWKKYFLTKDTIVARGIFKRHGIRHVKFISSETDKGDEISIINEFISGKRIEVFFLEVTAGKSGIYEKVHAPFRACIDFFGKPPRNFDLLINWDTYSRRLYNKSKYHSTHFLLGPQYVVLKKGIIKKANRPKKVRVISKEARNIMVSFGGFDEFNFTLKVIDFLESMKLNFNVRIILGAGYSDKGAIVNYVKRSKFCRFHIYQNVLNLDRHFLWADFTISSGGLTLFEAIALRIPAAVIAVYKHQIQRCVFFDRKRIIKYLGYRKFDKEELKKEILKTGRAYYRARLLSLGIPDVIDERLDHKIQ